MINLMFCGNSKMIDGLIISLLSISKNTKDSLNVFLMTMDFTEQNEEFKPITEEQRTLLEKILKKRNTENEVHLIDAKQVYLNELSNNKNIKTHYTPYIFIRLLVDKIKEIPDKILYLDTDIVCYKDISNLYNMDMSNYEIAMALDYLGRKWINPHYLNSGVLLMNLKKMRENKALEKARKVCETKRMVLPDQTALNEACEHIYILPDKYNEQYKRNEDTVIRHFSMTLRYFPYIHTLNIKPWHVEKIHKTYKIHDFDDIITEYLTIKEKYNINNSSKKG